MSLTIRIAFGLVAITLLSLATPSGAQTYVVDGPGSLTANTTLMKAAFPGGTRRVQFKTYQDVGSFSATGLNVDSLIFERYEESAEVLDVSGILFQIKGSAGPVVFRNLAFRLTNGAAVLLEGIGATTNKNLLLDSCIIYGDSIGSTFLSWAAGTGSKIEIRRSIFSGIKGGEGKIELSADSVRIANNYLNYSGLVSAVTPKGLELLNNTTNRVQFRFNGDFTGGYSIQRNLFAFPPIQTKLAGEPKKYVMTLGTFAGEMTASGNARFNLWSGYEFATISAFPEASNPTLNPSGDSTAPWAFQLPADIQRGYQNPSTALFPSYSVMPGDTTIKLRMGADSLHINLLPAAIPRVVTTTLGKAAYPGFMDSVRTFWLQDTVIRITGPATIHSLTFPKSISFGVPLLFSESGGTFQPGPAGAEGGLSFTNGNQSAKNMIPTFAGQNTPKGTQVTVKGLPPDTLLRYTTITRTGRTRLLPIAVPSLKKRWRILQRSGSAFGFRDSTSAAGTGVVRFGLGKSGLALPFRSDSLSWLLPQDVLKSVTDSAGKYWGDAPFGVENQAILIERMSLGSGKDTLILPQGRLVSASSNGFQVSIDSTSAAAPGVFPDMGFFSKTLAIFWPGRQGTDSLTLDWKKSNPLQKAYELVDGKAILMTPSQEDSTNLSIGLGIGDSGKVYFLARKFQIPSGTKTTLSVSADSVKDVLSSKPGDFGLDTSVDLQGLPTDSLRILAKRKVTLDNLELSGGYTLILKGPVPNREQELRGYVRRAGKWDSVSVVHVKGFYRFSALPGDTYFVAAEFLRPEDTLPVIPLSNPTLQVQGGRLQVKPVLGASEAVRLKTYYVELLSIDVNGKVALDTSKGLPGDSTFSLSLDGSKFYSGRIGYESFSGKMTWRSLATIPQDPLVFLNAAVSLAKPFKPAVWELISLPWDGSTKQDFKAGFTSDEIKNLRLEEWSGSWKPMEEETPFKKGRGYLGGFPKEFKPTSPATYAFTLSPDTLELDSGWQLVANPFPFVYKETSVKFDAAALSFFYELGWEGSGNSALPVWTAAETLKPFRGYAVHATKPTKIVFDPTQFKASSGLGKVGARSVSAKISIRGMSGDLKSQLFLQPVTSPRPTPAMSLFKGGFTAHWDATDGPVTAEISSDRVDAKIVLQSPDSRVVQLSINGEAPSLALWNPETEALALIKPGIALSLKAGENWFRVLEVEPTAVKGMEAQLKRGAQRHFEILPNYPNPFAGTTTLAFSIPFAAGSQSKVFVEVRSFSGRQVFRHTIYRVQPGKYTLPVDGRTWPPGQYVARLTFDGAAGNKILQRKLLRLGGNR